MDGRPEVLRWRRRKRAAGCSSSSWWNGMCSPNREDWDRLTRKLFGRETDSLSDPGPETDARRNGILLSRVQSYSSYGSSISSNLWHRMDSGDGVYIKCDESSRPVEKLNSINTLYKRINENWATKEIEDLNYPVQDKYHSCTCSQLVYSLNQRLQKERAIRHEAEQKVCLLETSVEDGLTRLKEAGERAVSNADWKIRLETLSCSNSQLELSRQTLKRQVEELEERGQELKRENESLKSELRKTEARLKRSESVGLKYQQGMDFLSNNLQARAESAETQLIEKIKECNDYLFRDPLSDPQVSLAMEKQKKEFSQKMNEKFEELNAFQQKYEALEKKFTDTVNEKNTKAEELQNNCSETKKLLEKKEKDFLAFEKKAKCEIEQLQVNMNRLKYLEDDRKHLIKAVKKLKSASHERGEKIRSLGKQLEQANKRIDELQTSQNHLVRNLVENEVTKLNEDVSKCPEPAGPKDSLIKEQAETIKLLKLSVQENKRLLEEKIAENTALESNVKELKLEVQHENVTIFNLVKKLEVMMTQAKTNESEANLQKMEKKKRENQQKEWEELISQTYNRKEKALAAAKYATIKYVDLIKEYQSKIKDHQETVSDLKKSLKIKDGIINKLSMEVKSFKDGGSPTT